ncbi:MAG: molecular chaperone DnaJ [Thermoguttaceae bacterium]
MRDYYEVLEVNRNASKDEIAVAYRKKAMQYHPDRNPGDEQAIEEFKLCAEAFDVLGNDQKRQNYDRFGHAGVGGGGTHFRDVGDIFSAFGDIFGDTLFGSFFGGGRGGSRVQRGGDVRCDLTIELGEAARGVSKTIQFQRHEVCTTCSGSGARPGSSPEICPFCKGQGVVTQSTGFFSIQSTCPRCRGQGKTITDPCPNCHGRGLVPQKVSRDIKIPAGVDNGTRLRIQGEGEKSPDGGPPGDCYVFIEVKAHPLFHREGQDLICRIPISYSQAALGAEIEVPTLDGREKLKIPAGTQSENHFTLRGRGMPIPRRNIAGDLHIQVYIEVPKHLSPDHEKILRELAEIEHKDVSHERKSFFAQLGEYAQYVQDFFHDKTKPQ